MDKHSWDKPVGDLQAKLNELEGPRAADLEARREQWRREALRAASRIVAHTYEGAMQASSDRTKEARVPDCTLELAEQFARWLETGSGDD